MNYKKIKDPETSNTYKRERIQMALFYAPEIYPCPNCGHPVARGYICQTCDYGSIEFEMKKDS